FFSLLFVLIGGPIVAGLILFLNKKRSFEFVFKVSVFFILIGMHIYFYSPPLKIIIPKNFSGQVNLIVDLDKKQNLNIDENGIGYIKKSILNKSRVDKKPRVFLNNGKRVPAEKIIGYDSIFFYGRNSSKGRTVLTFKILPDEEL